MLHETLLPSIDILAHDDVSTMTALVWKNLIFLRSGASLLGRHTFPTAEAARSAAEEGAVELKRLMQIDNNMRVVSAVNGDHLYFCREYSHCIQVPWKAE